MVKLLLDNNVEVNKPNVFNQTPLITIINRLIEENSGFENRCICFKIAEVLINHGADPNWVIDKVKGYTLLHTLCSSTLKLSKAEKQLIHDIIKFLIDKGANILQRGLDDKLPEDLAVTHCNFVAIIDLINKKKDKMTTAPIMRQRINSQTTNRYKDNSILRNTFEENTELSMFKQKPIS
jgi:ankyrin repeat protein